MARTTADEITPPTMETTTKSSNEIERRLKATAIDLASVASARDTTNVSVRDDSTFWPTTVERPRNRVPAAPRTGVTDRHPFGTFRFVTNDDPRPMCSTAMPFPLLSCRGTPPYPRGGDPSVVETSSAGPGPGHHVRGPGQPPRRPRRAGRREPRSGPRPRPDLHDGRH